MHEVRITVPKGLSLDIAKLAFEAGIDRVTVCPVFVLPHADGTWYLSKRPRRAPRHSSIAWSLPGWSTYPSCPSPRVKSAPY
jgi:hypothetical protein